MILDALRWVRADRIDVVIILVSLGVCWTLVSIATGAAAWKLVEGIRNHNHPATWIGLVIEVSVGVALMVLLALAMRVINSRYDCWRRPRWRRGVFLAPTQRGRGEDLCASAAPRDPLPESALAETPRRRGDSATFGRDADGLFDQSVDQPQGQRPGDFDGRPDQQS